MRDIWNGHVTFHTNYGNGFAMISAVVGRPYPLVPDEIVVKIIVGADGHTEVITDKDIYQIPVETVEEWYEQR